MNLAFIVKTPTLISSLAVLLLAPHHPLSAMEAETPQALAITDMPSPATHANDTLPYLTTEDGQLFMSWVRTDDPSSGHTTMYWSRWNGKTWADPQKIVSHADMFVNWADFPKIALNGKLVAAAWPQMLGSGTYAYGLRLAVSRNGGETWQDPIWLHTDTSPTEHGFVSMAPLADGTLAAAWLDGRAMGAAGHGGGGHDHHGEGSMHLLYRTIGLEGLGPEQTLDERTCECCNTAIATRDRDVWVAYRDRSDGEIRDIVVTHRTDTGWSTPRAAQKDDWKIMGCPVNGPALAARGQNLALAWFTAKGQPQIKLALSTDGGRQFRVADSLEDGVIGRVDVRLTPTNEVILLWVAEKDGRQQPRIAGWNLTGRKLWGPIGLDSIPTGRGGGFPRLAMTTSHLFIGQRATEGKGVRVMALPLDRGKITAPKKKAE
ncbi:Exo-alpha-sialidase [Sulfidibacter corallicola]|uniref:Exo-alpha-sialidase n=1 Tax=Sulfidibacter corallicola TaxID=2818388 RepID=A0A8A4TJ73_SULCO|nr:sialidase family protein [Sulfidibacter corallicola]QTD49600.1 exo-alpha-sialidase [Sulfidibacter corallicola]